MLLRQLRRSERGSTDGSGGGGVDESSDPPLPSIALPVLNNWSLQPTPTASAPPVQRVLRLRVSGVSGRASPRTFLARLRTPRRSSVIELAGVNLTASQSDDESESTLVPQTRAHRSRSVGTTPTGLDWSSDDDDDDGGGGDDGDTGDNDDDDDNGDDKQNGTAAQRPRRGRCGVVDDLSFSTATSSSNERVGAGDTVRRDRYKFELDARFLKYELQYLERKLKLDRKAPAKKKAKKLWLQGGASKPLKSSVVRAGIPPTHRRAVWLRMSGAAQLMLQMTRTETYDAMSRGTGAQQRPALAAQIQGDVHRMFPGHPILDAPVGVAKLRRLLTTYAARNVTVGYVPALTYVAAVLTLFLAEDEAFFLLTTLVENVLPPQYYTMNMCDVRVDCRLLSALVHERLPKLALHIAKLGAQQVLEAVFVQWLLSLFVVGMPTETMLRIWDCLLCCREGNTMLLRCCVALLKLNEAELLAVDDPQSLMILLYELPKRCFDCDQLFEIAFKRIGKFPLVQINNMRAQHKPAVMLELRQAMDHRHELEATARAIIAEETTKAHPRHSPQREGVSPLRPTGSPLHTSPMRKSPQSSPPQQQQQQQQQQQSPPPAPPPPPQVQAPPSATDEDEDADEDDDDDEDDDEQAEPTTAAIAAVGSADAAAANDEDRGRLTAAVLRQRRLRDEASQGSATAARLPRLTLAVDEVENVDPQESDRTVSNDVAEVSSSSSSFSLNSPLSQSKRESLRIEGEDERDQDEDDEVAEESIRHVLRTRRRNDEPPGRHVELERAQSGTKSCSEEDSGPTPSRSDSGRKSSMLRSRSGL